MANQTAQMFLDEGDRITTTQHEEAVFLDYGNDPGNSTIGAFGVQMNERMLELETAPYDEQVEEIELWLKGRIVTIVQHAT
jgi:hypothetical protein